MLFQKQGKTEMKIKSTHSSSFASFNKKSILIERKNVFSNNNLNFAYLNGRRAEYYEVLILTAAAFQTQQLGIEKVLTPKN